MFTLYRIIVRVLSSSRPYQALKPHNDIIAPNQRCWKIKKVSSQVFRSQYCMEVWGHSCESIDLPHYNHLVTEGNLQLGRAAYIVFQVALFSFAIWQNPLSEALSGTGGSSGRPQRTWQCWWGFHVGSTCRLCGGRSQESLHRTFHAGDLVQWLFCIFEAAVSAQNFQHSTLREPSCHLPCQEDLYRHI